jgi:hypothetical protein
MIVLVVIIQPQGKEAAMFNNHHPDTASCTTNRIAQVRPQFSVFPDGRLSAGASALSVQSAAAEHFTSLHSGIHIHAALDFISRTDAGTFGRIVRRLWEYTDEDGRQSLVYYLVLFRGEQHVRALFANPSISPAFLDAVVHSVSARNDSAEKENGTLEEILDLLPQETLYNLSLRENARAHDTAVLYILLKLDIRLLDRYFEDPARVRSFITGICAMPEHMIKSFFFRNPKLHGYYVFLFNAIDSSSISNAKELYSIDLSEVEAAKKIAHELKYRFDIDREMSLPLRERDKDRFAHIVNSVRHLSDTPLVLESLADEGVIDSGEKGLIEEILGNPLFRDVLEKFSSVPKLEENVVFDFML